MRPCWRLLLADGFVYSPERRMSQLMPVLDESSDLPLGVRQVQIESRVTV